jgi:hypothetical protein
MHADYIMLNYCTVQLYDLANKFLPKALVYLCFDSEERNNKVEEIINNMKNDNNWLANLSVKAERQNISLEECMRNDALYIVYQQPESCFDDLKGYKLPTSRNESLLDADRPLTFDEQVDKIIKQINSDSVWTNSIKEKAERNGKTFDEQAREDAVWILKQENR